MEKLSVQFGGSSKNTSGVYPHNNNSTYHQEQFLSAPAHNQSAQIGSGNQPIVFVKQEANSAVAPPQHDKGKGISMIKTEMNDYVRGIGFDRNVKLSPPQPASSNNFNNHLNYGTPRTSLPSSNSYNAMNYSNSYNAMNYGIPRTSLPSSNNLNGLNYGAPRTSLPSPSQGARARSSFGLGNGGNHGSTSFNVKPPLIAMRCLNCLMYVMVSKADPKCPKCKKIAQPIVMFQVNPAKRMRMSPF